MCAECNRWALGARRQNGILLKAAQNYSCNLVFDRRVLFPWLEWRALLGGPVRLVLRVVRRATAASAAFVFGFDGDTAAAASFAAIRSGGSSDVGSS